jgi:hypothetical protein
MRNVFIIVLLAFSAASVTSGCLVGGACTTELRYGVNVTVRNARTGVNIDNAVVTIVEGSYREPLTDPARSGVYVGAGERAGTYTLTVTATGFQPAAPRTLTVSAGECHVSPVSVTVDLTPQ